MKGEIYLLSFNLHKPKTYFLDMLLAKIIPGIYKSPLQSTEQHSLYFPLEKLKGAETCPQHTRIYIHI